MSSRRCIFCLTPSTTKEHLFAQWLREAFPRTARDTRTIGLTRWGQDKRGKVYSMPTRAIRQGHSGTTTVPFVCAGCNSGWMSRMETRARPILRPLIYGLPHSISTFDLKVLSGWIGKTVMVGEYLHPNHIAIPDSERLRMYAEFELPPTWSIWIADYQGSKWRNLAMFHHMGRVDPDPTGSLHPDTHFTSIGMGRLFIQAAATSSSTTIVNENDAMRQIWPLPKTNLSWPPARFIDDGEADFIADSFSRAMNLPHGGSIHM